MTLPAITSAETPVFCNGLKFGDATQDSVVIWTRLGQSETPEDTTYAIPPVDGDVQFTLRDADGKTAHQTEWITTSAERDGTVRIVVDGLNAGTTYQVTATARTAAESETVQAAGQFKTAPSADNTDDVHFAVLTCQKYIGFDDGEQGFRTYRMLRQKPLDFISHTGDAVYYDQEPLLAKNVDQARAHWHRMYALPNLRELHSNAVCYFIKDDHDTLKDDCWAGQKYGDLTFDDGVRIHKEQNPIGDRPYRTVRWGKHLQVWFAEGREFRAPNKMPDGPDKTIWGKEQLDWFRETVEASDATFRILVQATPLVGPDRDKKNDNHANSRYDYEGNLLRKFLSKHDMIAINGDRHWQYVSKDPETGLVEFGTGPVHDARAQGWKQDDLRPEHEFLRVKGGFLRGHVSATKEAVILTLSHHDVDGNETHRRTFSDSPSPTANNPADRD